MKKEIRNYQLELRASEEDGKRKVRGYAAVFEKFSVPMWNFREKIAKGAFGESLKTDDIRALWNHNTDLVLGRKAAGTLTLREDDDGLLAEIDLPDTSAGRDAFESIKRGDVSGMSFGFETLADMWEKGENKEPHTRTLQKVRLFEVSPCIFPAYPDTSIAVREYEGLVKAQEELWARGDYQKSLDEQRQKILVAEAWRPRF